jgi:hypothetical protein
MNFARRGNNLTQAVDAPCRFDGRVIQPADLRNYGGVMRIGGRVIISAILALGVAGSAVAAAEISAAVAHPSSASAHVSAVSANPDTFYRD